MKVILFLCLVALATCNSSTRRRTNMMPLGKVLSKAAEVGGSGFRRQSDSCVSGCSQRANEKVSGDDEVVQYVTNENSGYRFQNQFKPEMVKKICGVYNDSATCIQSCPESEHKRTLHKAMASNRYKCSETRFAENSACYFRVNNEVLTECNNKCSSKKSALQRNYERPMSSIDDVNTLVRSLCEYLDCDSDCEYPKVSQQCGNDAARVLQGYYKITIDGLKASLADKGYAMPSVCNNVGKPDDDE